MLTDSGIAIDGLPLVSCVTVTAGRIDLIGAAIRCFLAQTYYNREMIIVSQGTSEQNFNIRSMTAKHDNIHFIEAPLRLTLGEMRNLSVEAAHGQVICQWDDDDFYHPNRIMTQFKHLRGSVIACLYTKYLKYFCDTGRMYMIDHSGGTEDYLNVLNSNPYKRYLCGSLMFWKSCFHECKNCLYPERGNQSDKEEDLNVLQKIMKIGVVSGVDVGHEYCYVYHGGNVYDRKHHEMIFHKKLTATQEQLLHSKPYIETMLRIAQVAAPVEVCTTPLLDFDVAGTCVSGDSVYRIDLNGS